MPGPAQPWDHQEDPRDQTVDLPRIDLTGSGTGPGAPENGYAAPGAGNGAAANGHGARPGWQFGEPSRPKPSRPDPARNESARPDSARPDSARPDSARSERTRGALSWADPARSQARRSEPPRGAAYPPEPLPRRRLDAGRDPYARPADDNREPGNLFRPAAARDDGRPDYDTGLTQPNRRNPNAPDARFGGTGNQSSSGSRSLPLAPPWPPAGAADEPGQHLAGAPPASPAPPAAPPPLPPRVPPPASTLPVSTPPASSPRPPVVAESPAAAPPPARPTARSSPTLSPPAPAPSQPAAAGEPPVSASRAAVSAATAARPGAEPEGDKGGLGDSPASLSAASSSLSYSPPTAEPAVDRAQRGAGAAAQSQPARRRTARADSPGRPAPGSIRDLVARLDRLPDGHPSSPYEDGGLAKPLPHRLRQLELGLPAPEREPADPAAFAGFAAPGTGPGARPAGSSWQDPYARREQPNGHGAGERESEPSFRPWQGLAREESAPAADAANGIGERPAATRSAAPQSGDGQADLITGLVAAYRAAEGRNSLGSYGERGLTPAIRRIAGQLPRGGLAPGSETETVKSTDRLAAKLARLVARHPGRSPEELAAGIGDGIRYAFTFDPDYYTEGTWLVLRKLKAYGFELEARRNRWDSPEYKGLWTRWRDPAHGVLFEVQFHTGHSWDMMQRTHPAFVQITDPGTTAADRARLRARQVSAATTVKAPPRCGELTDFDREAR